LCFWGYTPKLEGVIAGFGRVASIVDLKKVIRKFTFFIKGYYLLISGKKQNNSKNLYFFSCGSCGFTFFRCFNFINL